MITTQIIINQVTAYDGQNETIDANVIESSGSPISEGNLNLTSAVDGDRLIAGRTYTLIFVPQLLPGEY
jgi:hypothetical protein